MANNFSRTGERPRDKKKAFIRLLRYMTDFKGPLLLAVVLTLLSNAFSLVGPKLSGQALDYMTGAGGVDLNGVARCCLWMALFYALSSGLSYILAVLMVAQLF